MYCVQTDFNNDGHLDVFVSRGAWLPFPIRSSLLRNDGDGTLHRRDRGRQDWRTPSIPTQLCWADYDNDGWLDVFVCCELHHNRLYHNRGDGTFEEVSATAGLPAGSPMAAARGRTGSTSTTTIFPTCSSTTCMGDARLYHNNRDGTFTDVTTAMGIDGPRTGFSCWAWDYDNDGWLDIFATCYDLHARRRRQGPDGPAAPTASPTGSSTTSAASASRT